MAKSTKILLIIATVLTLLGCTIFAVGMTMMGWDFTKVSTAKIVTNTYSVDSQFYNIAIDISEADVAFVPASDGVCKVVCQERANIEHPITVANGTLTISQIDNRKWYEFIGFSFASAKITVYLPSQEYAKLAIKTDTGDIEIPQNMKFEDMDIAVSTGDVKNQASVSGTMKIKTSTGHINLRDITAGTMDLSVSTGDIQAENIACPGDLKIRVSSGKAQLRNVQCRSFQSTGNTGDLFLNDVMVSEKLSVERSTGDVKLDRCDAGEITIVTDTGDVTGSLLTQKIFIVRTDTGKIDVPKTTSGGVCEITTDTGNIIMKVEQ